MSSSNQEFIFSLLPDWVKSVPKGLDPTMYGTGSYEGDLKIKERVVELLTSMVKNEKYSEPIWVERNTDWD